MNAPLLAIDNVSKTFPGGVEAIAPVTASIARGSFVSIVGPSGCGKSTLLRLFAGLLTPSNGKIVRSPDLKETGFVFQEPTLMPWANVTENVALPFQLYGKAGDLARVDEVLEWVGLDGFKTAYPRELSGGMQMRASIARAMVTTPQLLLMDEPFAALDEFTRFRLNDDLLALWRRHRWTVVFVTHSIREALFLSERVIVMSPRPGKVLADVSVDLPHQRDSALRTSPAFADQYAAISNLLSGAMSAAGEVS